MEASVIISTYNRSASLKRTIASLAAMDISGDRSWEVVVVDNNSSDRTREVVEELARETRLNLAYRFENIQGKSYALNRGISEARGAILAFTDDDVIVHPDWLSSILQAFRDDEVSCIGGRILLEWEVPRPAWLNDKMIEQLGYLDLGEEKIRLSEPKVYGGNFAIRSEVMQKYRSFDTDIGPIAEKMYHGEDTHFIDRLLGGGEIVMYRPDVIVFHLIPAAHVNKRYFLKRMFDQGEMKGIRMGEYGHRNLFGVPFYTYKEIVAKFFRMFMNQRSDPKEAFSTKTDFANCLGFANGRLKYFFGANVRQR